MLAAGEGLMVTEIECRTNLSTQGWKQSIKEVRKEGK